eukprot:1138807-Pelagomonas_calceolata.AAC.2
MRAQHFTACRNNTTMCVTIIIVDSGRNKAGNSKSQSIWQVCSCMNTALSVGEHKSVKTCAMGMEAKQARKRRVLQEGALSYGANY